MMGLAVGAAIEGMRPIIEIQFADFSTAGSIKLSIRPRRFSGAPMCRVRSLCGCLSGAHRAAGRFTASAWRLCMRIIRDWSC